MTIVHISTASHSLLLSIRSAPLPEFPSWVGTMSTSQRAVMPCGWGVKASMVGVWVAGTGFPLYFGGEIQ